MLVNCATLRFAGFSKLCAGCLKRLPVSLSPGDPREMLDNICVQNSIGETIRETIGQKEEALELLDKLFG